ncbi:MAG: YdcF family protein [Rhodanobacteraceae bacterium]
MIRWVVLSPLFLGILLAVLLWLGWRHWPRWMRTLGLAGVLACYLLMTPLVAEPLTRALESAARQTCTITPQAVVVLAGGSRSNARPGAFADLNLASMRRLMGGVALWRRQPPGTPLILSGGSGWGRAAESPMMAALAEQMGVPANMIRTETRSRNTWQNARNLARLSAPIPRQVWLVTSAMHMKRARYAMRQAGFRTCPAPVDYRHEPTRWTSALLPDSEALVKSDAVLHELIGLIWYHLKAWRSTPPYPPRRQAR